MTSDRGWLSAVRSPLSPRGKVEINRAMRELDDHGIHFPVSVGEIDSQQALRDAQVRGGAYGKKFGQAFHDAEQYRQQVVVQTILQRL
jgi:hypothetical protein